MGQPWQAHESWTRVEEASDAAGRDVAALLLDADGDVLRDTRNAQLTTFVSSLMVHDAATRAGLAAGVFAGHSLGEYTALTAAGALSFAEGVRLVVARSDAMHDAGTASPGTMAAVLGLDDDTVELACRQAGGDVWVANFNAPGQVVIAGSPAGVEAAVAKAKELGSRKVMALQVSGAFHTPFMAAASERLQEAIDAAVLDDTGSPVVSNVDAQPHQTAADFARLLSAQLVSPVRWRHGLVTMRGMGVTAVAELGPGGVLTGMAKRTLDGIPAMSAAAPADVAKIAGWYTPHADT